VNQWCFHSRTPTSRRRNGTGAARLCDMAFANLTGMIAPQDGVLAAVARLS
jgi:hypothetical protein